MRRGFCLTRAYKKAFFASMRPPYRAGTGRYIIAYIFSVHSFTLFLDSQPRRAPFWQYLLLPGIRDLYLSSPSSPATLVSTTNNRHAATPRAYSPGQPAQSHIGMSSKPNPHADLLIHETDRLRHR